MLKVFFVSSRKNRTNLTFFVVDTPSLKLFASEAVAAAAVVLLFPIVDVRQVPQDVLEFSCI